MDSIGVQLKNARVRQGLSLEEVSGQTKIPVKLLLAIESDDYSSVDSAFFYRSFVNQFAHCVGLDSRGLNEQLKDCCQHFSAPLMPGQDGDRPRPDLPGLAPKRVHKLRWVLSIMSLGVMLGACSTIYNLYESSRGIQGRQTSTNTALALPRGSDEAAGQPKVASDVLRIKLSAVKNTWLSLAADGHEVFKGTLHADESKTLEGQQTAQVRTKDAGAVEVEFNGRSLGKLGPEGQNRTIVFTRDSYNIVQAGLPVALASLLGRLP